MRLHSAPRSGNSYKVRLLLGLLDTRCEIVNYDTKGGQTHTPGFLENVNPDGKVPVLELEDGTMLPESDAILYYLAEGTPYLPQEKLERAQMLRWMFFEQYSLLLNLSRPRLWRMWGVEMTAQRRTELEQLFEQGYRALGVMERHLGDHDFSLGIAPRSQTSPYMCTRVSVLRAAMTLKASRRCVPGWSGSPLCRGMCRRPVSGVQGPMLIESTDEASGRKRKVRFRSSTIG